MGQQADYKSGNIANAKVVIESMQREIESLRREAKLPGNAHRKDYIKTRIANCQNEIKKQRAIIADWKKR